MTTIKLVPLCTAVAFTVAGIASLSPVAEARQRPVVITAPELDPELPTRRVTYADLNLASVSGERTLMRRVSGAVREVCYEAVPDGKSFDVTGCRKVAWDGANPQIDRALQRAREIAATGRSSIAAAAITLSIR